MGLSEVRLCMTLCIGHAYAQNSQSTLRDYGALVSSNGKHQVVVQEAIDHIIIPEYLATRKEGIAYFIYKATPLLSIDIDKKQYARLLSSICRR